MNLKFKEMKKKEGTWIEESDIKYPIVNSNTDVYWLDDEGKKHLLLNIFMICFLKKYKIPYQFPQ